MSPAVHSPIPGPTRVLRRSQIRPAPLVPREYPVEKPSVRVPEAVVLAPAQTAPAAVSRVQVVEHPAAQHALTMLRGRQTKPQEFRDASDQLLFLLAVEAMRSLPVRDQPIETDVGPQTGCVLAKTVVLLSITREGLGMAHRVAECLPGFMVGAISIDTGAGGQGLQARIHLANAPALADARVMLFEPVASTGLSASLALNLVRRSGATDVCLLSFLASSQALCRMQAAMPELSVWTAAINSDWDATRGPMPGFGGFSARLLEQP